MFSISASNRETPELYNKTSHGNITTREEVVEQQSRLGSNKRPLASRSVNWNQPSTSKRCRRNSFSSSEPEGIEINNTNYMDQEYSCSSNNSSSFSPSHQSYQQAQQEHVADEATARNQQRLLRTTEMLKESGLYDVAVRTAALIRQNQQSLKELEELREETKLFLKDVLNNPENKKISQILSGLQQNQQNLQKSSLENNS